MEKEPLEAEQEEWKKERMRVLDEWCEIELKGADALKQEVTTEPATGSAALAPETSLEELCAVLLTTSSSENQAEPEEEDVTTTTTSSDSRSRLERLLDVCLCRPAGSTGSLSPRTVTHKLLLARLARSRYDGSNGAHWLLLSDYFVHVASAMRTSSEEADDVAPPRPARCGPHWVTVGFQSATPETDFRGCGVLGLLQMHTFTLKLSRPVLRAIVKLATTEPNDFPLAVVSINITSLLLTQLKKGAFDSFGTHSDGLYPFFASLHAAALAKFCAIYKTKKCSLAQTQSIFSELSRQLEKSPVSLISLLNANNDEIRNSLLL